MFEEKKLVCGSQWVIDTYYPDYKELIPLMNFDPKFEYSHETTAYKAKQFPVWTEPTLNSNYRFKIHDEYEPTPELVEQIHKIAKWAQAKILQHRLFHTLTPAISWYVTYDEGGWQGMHTHDNNCITQIIYLDGINHMTTADPKKEQGWGAMFALMQSKDNQKYVTFNSIPGRCIILPGTIYHGVYPVKSQPRRTVVIDYFYKKP